MKLRTRFLAAVGAAMLLAACASAEKMIASAEVTYTRLVMQADEWAQKPRCPQPAGTVCVDQEKVDKAVEAAVVGDQALDNAWRVFATYENSDAENADAMIDTAVEGAMAAVDTFEAVIGLFGPQKSTLSIERDGMMLAVLPDGKKQLAIAAPSGNAYVVTWR